MSDQNRCSIAGEYTAGLNRVREPVISSHFMHQFSQDSSLALYDDKEFRTRSVIINSKLLYDSLIPAMLKACEDFSKARAAAARQRAAKQLEDYGLQRPSELGIAEFITEVMFDRQFRRGKRETCSRRSVCAKVKNQIASNRPIDMVIPALPFKISNPLKTRGQLPDLAEVNFLLGLHEIVTTIELLYREAVSNLPKRSARFTIVSDGRRFNRLVGEPDSVVRNYQSRIHDWIQKLGLEDHIRVLDYRALLSAKLSVDTRKTKATIRARARIEYANTLSPLFNPNDMATTIKAAVRADPDPESANPEGRFVSLLKSLIYTIKFKAMEGLGTLPPKDIATIYQDVSAHIFEPYFAEMPEFGSAPEHENECEAVPGLRGRSKEFLRQSMLVEAWNVTIEYMAEIKSDRDLAVDPIQTCLPNHLRWTIHPKPGQLAISTTTALGFAVQSWAGAAVFKLTKNNGLKLCTLPVLVLEGSGAIPILVAQEDNDLKMGNQPLFYVYSDIEFTGIEDLVSRIGRQLERTRYL